MVHYAKHQLLSVFGCFGDWMQVAVASSAEGYA
jgi:hypothetical protein